jgi:hypothetical protein
MSERYVCGIFAPAPLKVKHKSYGKPLVTTPVIPQTPVNLTCSFHSLGSSLVVNDNYTQESHCSVLRHSHVFAFLKVEHSRPWFDFCRSGPDPAR